MHIRAIGRREIRESQDPLAIGELVDACVPRAFMRNVMEFPGCEYRFGHAGGLCGWESFVHLGIDKQSFWTKGCPADDDQKNQKSVNQRFAFHLHRLLNSDWCC